METKGFLFIILAVAYSASMKISAQETNISPAPSPLTVIESEGFQLSMSWAVLWLFLFLFFFVNECLFANTDSDTYPFADIDSEQNLPLNPFANVVNDIYRNEQLLPLQMGPGRQHDDNHGYQVQVDIGPLSSSDLQQLVETVEELAADDDDQAGKYLIDLNGLVSEEDVETMDHGVMLIENNLHAEYGGGGDFAAEPNLAVGENIIDLTTLVLSDLSETEPMDVINGNRHTENNLHAENSGDSTDLAYEEADRVVLDHHLDRSPDSEGIELMYNEVRHYTKHNLHSEPNLAQDQVRVLNEQMQSVHNVNDDTTCVNRQNCSRGGKRKMGAKKVCGITLSRIEEQFGKKAEDAAKCLGVSKSTFKRYCRENGIGRWSKMLTATTTLLDRGHATSSKFQYDTTTMSVKVSYNGEHVKFPLAFSSGKNDLEAEVEKRFGIQIGSFSLKYLDDEDKEWISVKVDQDLHHGMCNCKTMGIATIKMKVELT